MARKIKTSHRKIDQAMIDKWLADAVPANRVATSFDPDPITNAAVNVSWHQLAYINTLASYFNCKEKFLLGEFLVTPGKSVVSVKTRELLSSDPKQAVSKSLSQLFVSTMLIDKFAVKIYQTLVEDGKDCFTAILRTNAMVAAVNQWRTLNINDLYTRDHLMMLWEQCTTSGLVLPEELKFADIIADLSESLHKSLPRQKVGDVSINSLIKHVHLKGSSNDIPPLEWLIGLNNIESHDSDPILYGDGCMSPVQTTVDICKHNPKVVCDFEYDGIFDYMVDLHSTDTVIRFVSDKYKSTEALRNLCGNPTAYMNRLYNFKLENLAGLGNQFELVAPQFIIQNDNKVTRTAAKYNITIYTKENEDEFTSLFFDGDKPWTTEAAESYDELYSSLWGGETFIGVTMPLSELVEDEKYTLLLDAHLVPVKILRTYKDMNFAKTSYLLDMVQQFQLYMLELENYMLAARNTGEIDFTYYDEEAEVHNAHASGYTIRKRKGCVVRGHFRHYKSGIVTLVKPHKRKGTNVNGALYLDI